MGVVFGLLTSLAIGASDLFGRKVLLVSSAITVGVTMQFVGILASVASLGVVASTWNADDFALGALSGLGLGTGLGCYFGGLQRSTSTVVAPVVATLSATIPFVYTITTGDSVAASSVAGAAVAFIGLVMITSGGGATHDVAAGLKWGLVSGLGYGFGLSVLTETTEASGAWPAVGQRVAAFLAFTLLASVARQPRLPPTGLRRPAVFAGIAIGLSTVFLLIGLQADAPSAVVAASVFPAVTVAVGWRLYNDAISRLQVAGIGVVLVGLAGVVSG